MTQILSISFVVAKTRISGYPQVERDNHASVWRGRAPRLPRAEQRSDRQVSVRVLMTLSEKISDCARRNVIEFMTHSYEHSVSI